MRLSNNIWGYAGRINVMPEEGEVLKFNGWGSMQRHSFTIYADFEALLEK